MDNFLKVVEETESIHEAIEEFYFKQDSKGKKEFNENIQRLFDQLLPKNKMEVLLELIGFVASIQKNLWEEGILSYNKLKPLQQAANLVSVSSRQFRNYLKGSATPSAKVVKKAFDSLPETYCINLLYYDLLDKLKLIQEEFPGDTNLISGHSDKKPLSPTHLEEGLGGKYMSSVPKVKIYQEEDEYILECEEYCFAFSTIKFKTDEEKLNDFFDSGKANYEGDWASFKEELDSTMKILPRLEGQEESDTFQGWTEEEIARILEFAEQLDLGKDKKSKLEKLLKEGKEYE